MFEQDKAIKTNETQFVLFMSNKFNKDLLQFVSGLDAKVISQKIGIHIGNKKTKYAT